MDREDPTMLKQGTGSGRLQWVKRSFDRRHGGNRAWKRMGGIEEYSLHGECYCAMPGEDFALLLRLVFDAAAARHET